MAPTGSRTVVWPLFLLTILAILFLVLAGFHTRLISGLNDFGLRLNLSPELRARESLACRSTDYHSELPRASMVFRERPVLEDLSIAADDAWKEATLTRKGGFLWVESNKTSQVPYGISMFHGLHCLQMLRTVIRDSPMMRDVVKSPNEGEIRSKTEDSGNLHPDMDPIHIGHCIGYIAQHLMCAADSTIEVPWTTMDNYGQILEYGVDGEGYQHQCRDSASLWETAANSETAAVKPWNWQQGDTIESVFGVSSPRGKS